MAPTEMIQLVLDIKLETHRRLCAPKGDAREVTPCLCSTCGTNNNVKYDINRDEYICASCIRDEQEIVDELDEEINNRDKHDEETYRKGVDDEKA